MPGSTDEQYFISYSYTWMPAMEPWTYS